MALDSHAAVMYVVRRLRNDVTFIGILGGQKVYRKIADRGATPPVVVVQATRSAGRIGAVMTGPNTHVATPTWVQVSIWDRGNYDKIEDLAARADVLLDGQGADGQIEESDGTIWESLRWDEVERDMHEGDVTLVGYDITYRVVAKSKL